MKRIITFIMAVCVFSGFCQLTYAVDYKGFTSDGWYSDTLVSFGFEPDESVLVYNKDVYPPDYDEIWPGSAIYVPVYKLGLSGQANAPAADKDIKDYEIAVSHKTIMGDKYIDDVTLVNGQKEKITGLENGIYAKILINNAYTGQSRASVELKMVLSIKKLTCPETQATLKMDIVNREVNIGENTVYTAQSPTQFYALKSYGGAATFDFGSKIRYNARVAKGTHYYLNLDRSEQKLVRDMYPDAYMEFLNFVGDRDSFAGQGTLQIPVTKSKFTPKGSTKAQVFVYEISGDKLRSLDGNVLSFDSAKSTITLKTQVLGNYVISDRALERQVNDEDETVLYTGYADAGSNTSTGTTGTTNTTGSGSTTTQQPPVTTGTLPNDNVNTGLDINAANNRATNPSTSDAPLELFVFIFLVSGAAWAVMWKSGWVFQKNT